MTTTITLAYPANGSTTEAHLHGCKAASRKSGGFPTEVREGFQADTIKAMLANPDEGTIKVHACAREALAAPATDDSENVETATMVPQNKTPNPILADALHYYAERRPMNNPKGWDHVLRVVRRAIDGGVWPAATTGQKQQALDLLETLSANADIELPPATRPRQASDMAKMGTQDKARAKRLQKTLVSQAKNFKDADLGDRADRIGPQMVETIEELQSIPGWAD